MDIEVMELHSDKRDKAWHKRFDRDHKFALTKIWDKYYTFWNRIRKNNKCNKTCFFLRNYFVL
jgi:hypothetical protein